MENAVFKWKWAAYTDEANPWVALNELFNVESKTAMTLVEPHVRNSYINTLAALKTELPINVRLVRLEKHSYINRCINKWVLTFYIDGDLTAKEATAEIEGKLGLGGDEVYSEVPYVELLTKVRVFL